MGVDVKVDGRLIGMVSPMEIGGKLYAVAYFLSVAGKWACLGEYPDEAKAEQAIRQQRTSR